MNIDIKENLIERFKSFRHLIETIYDQQEQIEKQIKLEGIIEKEICENCPKKEIINVEILDNVKEDVEEFVNWMSDHQISHINSTKNKVIITAEKTPIFGYKGTSFFEKKDVEIRKTPKLPAKITNQSVRKFLELEYSSLEPCTHIHSPQELSNGIPVLIKKFVNESKTTLRISDKEKTPLEKVIKAEREKPSTHYLKIACVDCHRTIERKGCETSIRKRGLFYLHRCPVFSLVFEKIFQENLIDVEPIELSEHQYMMSDLYFDYDLGYYSRTLKTFFMQKRRMVDEEVIQKLEPEIIAYFGSRSELLELLPLKCKLIIVAQWEEGKMDYYFYDPSKRIAENLDPIITKIVNDLRFYTKETTGKEHDRLILAFEKIGEELGFITQIEKEALASRVDVAWSDGKGSYPVAIEIETSSGWKKDILSTWELQPKLAIIVCHYKTDKGIKDLISYPILLHLPHKLLYINNSSGKVYLLDKQDIVAKFDLKEA
ncbi:MAG: hypothetical protein ACFE9L_00170 [Candidatus Hodarchaeota archaeon]